MFIRLVSGSDRLLIIIITGDSRPFLLVSQDRKTLKRINVDDGDDVGPLTAEILFYFQSHRSLSEFNHFGREPGRTFTDSLFGKGSMQQFDQTKTE